MNKCGNFLIILGVLVISAGLFLAGYNLVSDFITGDKAAHAAGELVSVLYAEEGSSSAGTQASLDEETVAPASSDSSSYSDDFSMKTLDINGYCCVGVLYFPKLELVLPVSAEYTVENLKNGPCRFSGSIAEHNLVICAHNTSRHFGKIKYYTEDEAVWFIDAEGNQYEYAVCEKRTLEATQITEMCSPDEESTWDMTLFTCNNGGVTRLAIRCVLVESYAKEQAPLHIN